MSSKGATISAASIGITIGPKEAMQVERNLMILALDDGAKGDIRVTAYPSEKRMTIIRNKTWQRGVDGTAAPGNTP
jgi:hypothetical protein